MFNLKDRVHIKDTNICGRIIGISYTEHGRKRFVIKQDNGMSAVVAEEDLEVAEDAES